MKTIRKKHRKAINKAVRKAVKRHSIATGFITGVGTAVVLSSTGISRAISESLGGFLGNLLRVRREANGQFFRGLKHAAGDALTRAGHYFHPEEPPAHARPSVTRSSRAPSPS